MNIDNNNNASLRSIHLKPLNLVDLMRNGGRRGGGGGGDATAEQMDAADGQQEDPLAAACKCMLCDDETHDLRPTSPHTLSAKTKEFLKHLLERHRLVIADVERIGHLAKYVMYWRQRLLLDQPQATLDDVCFRINTNTGKNDDQSKSIDLLSLQSVN